MNFEEKINAVNAPVVTGNKTPAGFLFCQLSIFSYEDIHE
jgi:hypothetical protein